MRKLMGRSALGLFTALTLATAACGSDSGGGDGGAGQGQEQEQDPTTLLTSSVDALNEETFKIEMTMGDLLNGTGQVDAPNGAAQMAISSSAEGQALDIEMILTPSDMWMSLGDLGAMMGVETPWMHVDLSQLGEDGFMGLKPGETDFAQTTQLLQAITEVEQVDDVTFQGEIDPSKAEEGMIDQEMLGDAATVPFTATLDDQGRLTQIALDLPDMEGMPDSMVVRYYDFGQPVEIGPPPAEEVSEMPPELYDALSGM